MEKSEKKFNPSGNYTWKRDEMFTLTGDELGTLTDAIRMFVNSEQAQAVIAVLRANKVIDTILNRAYQDDKIMDIKELPQNEKAS